MINRDYLNAEKINRRIYKKFTQNYNSSTNTTYEKIDYIGYKLLNIEIENDDDIVYEVLHNKYDLAY